MKCWIKWELPKIFWLTYLALRVSYFVEQRKTIRNIVNYIYLLIPGSLKRSQVLITKHDLDASHMLQPPALKHLLWSKPTSDLHAQQINPLGFMRMKLSLLINCLDIPKIYFQQRQWNKFFQTPYPTVIVNYGVNLSKKCLVAYFSTVLGVPEWLTTAQGRQTLGVGGTDRLVSWME